MEQFVHKSKKEMDEMTRKIIYQVEEKESKKEELETEQLLIKIYK